MGIFTKKKVQHTKAAYHRVRSRRRRLFLEQLEDRKLLASLFVTNTGESDVLGSGSLRSAILEANQSINVLDTIKFNIGGGGVQTIHLTSALPPITDPLIINGTTQPGFAGTPLIELDGTSAGAGANGLNITASNTTVRSLVINNFSQNGILLSGGGNDLIAGNYIGTDVGGTLNRGNSLSGIMIQSSSNTVGGTGAWDGNVISGNKGTATGASSTGGIVISNANNNLLNGNLIGTNAVGTGVLANAGFGVVVLGSSTGNIIGGSTASERNVVSGNSKTGIALALGTTSNLVLGNYVGTDITGANAIGNTANGVLVTQASNGNTIKGNVISGNGLAAVGGVNIINSNNNVVQGNKIGTNAAGTGALGNKGGGAGVAIQANAGVTSSGNLIGGTSAVDRNIISGNLKAGVWFNGPVTGNYLQGNYIGMNAAGTAPLPNTGNGVQLTPVDANATGANNNIIGGTAPGAGNLISGNSLAGIALINTSLDGSIGSGVIGNWVVGNSIHDNSGLGIDLGGAGVTLNDTLDADTGPNNLQNFPVLTAAQSGSSVLVSGTLNSAANKSFTIDVYASPTADPSGYGEGQYYLGATTVATNASGNASFAAAFSAAALPGGVVSNGWAISATATDPTHNTSEFSADVSAASGNALQSALTAGGTVAIQTTTADQAHAIFTAANALNSATTPTSTIILDLGGQTIQDTKVNIPPQVTLTIVNGTFIGGSPALIVESGVVSISNSTFTNATDSPTILVTGGSLILRNDTVQESTGYNQAAISITGGSLDLGTASQPGHNILNVNGAGQLIDTSTPNAVSAFGNTLEVDGVANNTAPAVVSINRTVLSAATTNAHSVSYTVTFSDFVIGVDASDFQLAKTGSLATTSTQVTLVSGSVYTVTVSDITGDGQLRLDLVDDFSIHDLAGSNLVASALFENQQTFAAGNGPHSLLMGDVNHDGNLDIVLQQGSSMGLMLGNNDGTFRELMTIGPGISLPPQQIVDFDSDGNPDILFLFGNSSPAIWNYVAVMRGNGDGTFQDPTIISDVTKVGSAMLTDITNDGIPDLILRSDPFASNFVRVQVGNSDHSFQSPQTFTTGNNPYSIAVADVDGDHNPDLVVANGGSNSVGILKGNGDGTFQVMQTFGTGRTPDSVAVADFNRDGSLDLVVVNGSDSNVGVLLGDGHGAFQNQQTIAVVADYNVAVADFDGDSIPDLVVPGHIVPGQSTVSVLLGIGNGSFQNAQNYAAGISTQSAVVADVNHDGKPDIVVANYWHDSNNIGSNIGVFLNAIHGNYVGQFYNLDTTPPQLTLPPDQTFESFSAQPLKVHYTGATATDAVSANPTITYSVPQDTQLSIGTTVVSVTATDAVGNQTTGTFEIIVLPSSGPFIDSITPSSSISSGTCVYTVTFSQSVTGVDVSDFQLVRTGTVAGGTIQIAPVSGSVYKVTISGVTGNGSLGLNFVDDGSIQNAENRRLVLQNVSGSFRDLQTFAIEPVLQTITLNPASVNTDFRFLAEADLNGDGKLDIIVGKQVREVIAYNPYRELLYVQVAVRLNMTANGAPSAFFAPEKVIGLEDATTMTVATADLNSDGKTDLIFGSAAITPSGRVVRLNTTPAGANTVSFALAQTFGSMPQVISLSVADVNSDGNPDIVSAAGDGTVSVLLNSTTAGNTALSFAPEQYVGSSAGNVRSMAVTDFNGDGKPDIVIDNRYPYTISVLQNTTPTGSATTSFAASHDFSHGPTEDFPSPYMMTVADMNTDGKLDVVLTGYPFTRGEGGQVLMNATLNAGDSPYFGTPQHFDVGALRGRAVIATDLNADGKPDLIVLGDNVSVSLNTTPSASAILTFTTTQRSDALSSNVGIAGDLNGDGKPDVVIGFQGGIGVLLNAYSTNLTGDICTIDTAAPQLTLPPDQIFKAPQSQGVEIHFAEATATDNGSSLTITYSVVQDSLFSVGNHVVTATATDAAGNQTVGTFNIAVEYTPPTAIIGDIPTGNTINENAVAVFIASALHPLNPNSADVFTYNWTVSRNGNIFASGTDPNIAFWPDDNGTDIVTLTATDSDGATSAPVNVIITVLNASPLAVINFFSPLPADALGTPTSVPGMLLAFSGYAYDSPADMEEGFHYNWSVAKNGTSYSLPAGTVTNTADFSFTPTTVGDYVVSLVATDKDGGVTNVSQAIDITSMNATSLQNVINYQAYYATGWQNATSFAFTLQTDSAQLDTVLHALSGLVEPMGYNSGGDFYFPVPTTVSLNLTSGSYQDVHVRLQPGITVIVNAPDGSKTIVGGAMTVTATGPDSGLAGTEAIFSGSFSSPTGIDDGPFSYSWTVVANNGQVVPVISGNLSDYPGVIPDLTFTPSSYGNYSIKLTISDIWGSSAEYSVAFVSQVSVFAPSQEYAVGVTPFGVVVGDFNGDAISDLATTNLYSDDISILRGNGDGTFQTAVNISVGPLPVALTSADFDGDGTSDLAVTNQGGTDRIVILLGNHDGTISAGMPFAVGVNPTSISVGDFDGNGKVDLAVANFSSGDISILLGNGDGTFQTAVNYFNGPSPYDILVADFDGDQLSDLAIANIDDNTVSILFGNGNGTFQAPVYISAGARTGAVNAGDFNGDGKSDLVVTSLSSSEVSILVGRGDGTFDSPVYYAVGYWSNSVVIADFNGDGKSDLAVPTNSSNVVSILFGNGDATFRTAAIVTVGLNPVEVAVGDFNRDGKNDLVATNWTSNDVSVLINTTLAVTVTSGPTVGLEGTAATFSGSFSEPAGSQIGPYTYTWSVEDDNADVVLGTTGTLNGYPATIPNFTFTPQDNGTYTVTLTVTDQQGNRDFDSRTLLVTNVAPTLTNVTIGSPRITGTAITVTGSASDPAGVHDTLSFAWSVYKNSNTAAYATASGSSFTFTPDEIANYTVVAIVSDEDGGSSTASSTIAVSSIGGTAGNDAIAINPGTASGSVKATVNGVTQDNIQLTGVLQILGLAGNDTITINASLASGLNIDGGEGADTVIISAGNLTGALSVADSGSASNVDSLNVNGTAGNDTLTKSLSQVIVVSTSTATINYAGIEQFTLDGKSGDDSYTVDFGGTAQTMTAVADSGPAIDSNILTVNGTSSNDFLYKNSGLVQWKPLGGASFIQRLDFSNIDLTNLLAGDGNDTVQDPGASTQIFGGPGDDTIIIDATTGTGVSAFGGEGNDRYIINLGNLAGPVTVTDSAGTNAVQVIGTPGNDDLTLTSTATSSQLATGTGETINLNVGGATATALAIDGGGGTNNVTVQGAPPPVQITATHMAPVVGMISAPVDPKQVSTIINVSASFTDMDLGDHHTAVWNWGDGSSTSTGTTVTITEPSSSAPGSVTGSHAYSSAGVYTITLTVMDMYGASAQSVFQYIVVYDPSAGFVTGGGWINSPAGAYTATPGLTGKANFGFESKYLNGNNVPTGNTEFQFKLANFNFKSTSYEWLVVSGAKARYKGVGTVNGAGSYGFELTAWDGQVSGGGGVDKFRIKIWNNNQGNGVVYDNLMGAADGADPTTTLGGGSIVIHKSGQPLLASGGTSIGSGPGSLSQETLNQAVDKAIDYWQNTGVGAAAVSNLHQIHVEVADLQDVELGIASDTDYVWIDRDAAGYGWQLDTMDANNNILATGGMDLLSVVAHELGHKLGLEHSHDDSDVMAPTLHVGVRTLVGNLGQPLGYFSTNSVLSENLKIDVVRLRSRDTTRLLKEDSEELQAHDQLLASYDAGPAKPTLRNVIAASKYVSDAKQKSVSASEDALEEDLMEVIAAAHLVAR